MALFDWGYTVSPDPHSGNHGVYSAHVKYATDRHYDIDVWMSREWLGAAHPGKLLVRFLRVEQSVPDGWHEFHLVLRLPGESRREYCSREVDSRDRLAVTGVYIDKDSVDTPPPQNFVMWVREPRG